MKTGRAGDDGMRWLNDITDSMGMSLSKLRQIVKDSEVWRAAVPGVTKSREQLSDSQQPKTDYTTANAYQRPSPFPTL